MTHPAMDTDALRRVAEAHHVAGAAMYRLADAIKEMGDVTQPAVPELPAVPAAEKEQEPEGWRNDRPPSEGDADDDGRVWVWDGDWPAVKIRWYHAVQLTQDHKQVAFWAPGSHPAPTSPAPSVVAGQEPEPKSEPEAPPEHEEPHTGGWIVDRVPEASDSSDEARGLVRIPQRPGTPQRPPSDPLLTCHWSAVHLGQPWAPIGWRMDPWYPTCLDRNGWIRSRLPTVEDAGYYNHVLIPVGNGGTTSSIAYHLIVPGQPWAPLSSNPGRFEK